MFLLFAAALVLGLALGATRAEASLPRSADAAALDTAAIYLRAAAAGVDAAFASRAVMRELVDDDALEHALDVAPRLGFAEELCLLELDHAQAGFGLFERETCQCERTYARNNPLRYVDPDGNAPRPPEWVNTTASVATGFIPVAGEIQDATIALTGYDPVTSERMGGRDRIMSGAALFLPLVGGAALSRLLGRADDAADGVTDLYRAVKQPELEGIQRSGAFSNPTGVEVKYFSTTEQGAASYAKQADKAFKDGPYTVVKTSIPTKAITPDMKVPGGVDRGIPTVVVPTEKVCQLGAPCVLPSMPVPR